MTVSLVLPPCQVACPISTDVHGYVALIAQERFDDALKLIRETNPFPSVCGRICTHPCESACLRTQVDEAVAIRGLKRFATEAGKIRRMSEVGGRKLKTKKEAKHPSVKMKLGSPDETGRRRPVKKGDVVEIDISQRQSCGICASECPAMVISLRQAGGEVEREVEEVVGKKKAKKNREGQGSLR